MELGQLSKTQVEFKPFADTQWMTLKEQVLASMSAKTTYKAKYLSKDINEARLADDDYVEIKRSLTFVSPDNFDASQVLNAMGTPGHKGGGAMNIWRIVDGIWYTNPLPGSSAWIEEPETARGDKVFVRERREIYKDITFKKFTELLEKERPLGLARYENQYSVVRFVPTDPSAREKEIITWIADKDKTIRFVQISYGNGLSEELYFSNYNFPFRISRPKLAWE
ncbi:MAG: hypothetical protein HZC16_02380 [Candidatus Omnitrophica bacterium]|nr:hypothetical protein [Candidatus Omnitrophota bacterium]